MFVVSGLFTRFQLGGLLHCLSLPTAVLPANEGEREDWLERWREMRNRKEEEGFAHLFVPVEELQRV